MRLRSGGMLAAALALTAAPVPASQPEPPSLASRALAVLQKHCASCHGQGGSAKGGFGYVLDRDRLVSRQKVIPGSPAESDLFQRIIAGEMPPPSAKKPHPDKDEIDIVRQWIVAGAPPISPPAKVEFIRHGEMVGRILADLETIAPRHRRHFRYLTLTHLLNAGAPEAELDTVRKAIAKLINALSWHPRITVPVAIDPARTVYRLDLRDYRWAGSQWDRLVNAYPYRLEASREEVKAFSAMTGVELPHLRGDWFVATASRTPLYYDLLQLPVSERGVERLLLVDVPQNLKDETAVRAGFNDSGVSKHNRLIERHDAAFGALWRSYDFEANNGRQNLFEHPLGPLAGETSFRHAGGEMIYHLPNGLHGYFLADANGRRINKGPIEVVSDPKRPDQQVEAGISCMSCHARGYLPKADQVRAHVEKNRKAFPRADFEAVLALYAPRGKTQALMDEDNKRYLAALKLTGVSPDEEDPVNAVTLRYEGTLDLHTAAAEFGTPASHLEASLRKSRELARPLGALVTKGGNVQRQLFEASFAEATRLLRQLDAKAATTQEAPRPFTGHAGWVTAIAVSPDGKRVVTGGEDRTVRVWNLPGGEEVARLTGHTAEVTCVAFSPDAKQVISGSRDRTLRLWDVAAPGASRTLKGHTAAVRCVAFSPDGKRVATGDDDHAIRVWEVATGRELQVLTGHSGAVRALAYGGNGWLVSGGHDRTARVWDKAGREVARFTGHTREVLAVAVSADGKRVLSGGNDRTVRLWELKTGKALGAFEGHANAVIAVAFADDGTHGLSASSRYQTPDRVVRLWDLAGGREVNAWAGGERGVGCVAFGPTGISVAVGGGERFWSHWHFGN